VKLRDIVPTDLELFYILWNFEYKRPVCFTYTYKRAVFDY